MARDWKLHINNFAEVEQYYHSIRPVISKNHSKADDIRPLHNRSTKHERIRKISDDIYLLMDGYAYGDDQFHWTWQGPAEEDPKPSEDEMVMLAAIAWIREGNTEMIKIRNGTGEQSHNRRYAFLDWALPTDMRFLPNQGKQYVWYLGKKYYSPKSETVGWTAYNSQNVMRGGSFRNTYQSCEDGMFLLFEREIGSPVWNISSRYAPVPAEVVVKHRIKKDLKREVMKYAESFWDWAVSMGPILPTDESNYGFDMRGKLFDLGVMDRNGWVSSKVKKVLSEPDHEARLPLLVTFLWEDSDLKTANSVEDLRKCRGQFNRWINKTCGLIETIEEIKEH